MVKCLSEIYFIVSFHQFDICPRAQTDLYPRVTKEERETRIEFQGVEKKAKIRENPRGHNGTGVW